MKVSVIIPYHNRPQKLKRAVQSVLSQTLSDFEILIIDDASPIPPPEFSDPRIQTLRNPANSGPGVARNRGLDAAKGEYIAFLDSDDYWHNNFLEIAIEALRVNPKAAMAYTNGYEIDPDQNVKGWRRGRIKNLRTILPYTLRTNRHWGTSGCLWRKSAINGVRWLDTRIWEDYAFDIEVATKNNAVVALPGTLVYYDISGDDKLSSQPEHNQEKLQALLHIAKTLTQSEDKNDKTIKKSLNYILYTHGYETFSQKNNSKTFKKNWLQCYGVWNGTIKLWFAKTAFYMPFTGTKLFMKVGEYRNRRVE